MVFVGRSLFDASYSRDAERGADAFAIDVMHELGRSPKPMGDFLFRVTDEGKYEKTLSILSSHPLTQDRRDLMNRQDRTSSGPELLSAAEWAFSLGRQIGTRVSGKSGRLGYSFSVSNSISGSDVGSNQNTHEKLAAILNVNYDVLEPYGYQETDPGTMWVNKPQLSIWASAMYNPVEYTSVFQNDLKGDKTHGATASVNYRYGHFSTQVSGYYKKNEGRDGNSSFESHGWQEQAGYYLVPGKLELAQRIDQVRWGRGQIAESGGKANQWYAGPANFSFNRLTEYTAGLNYYFVGHKAKTQLAYSYLDGKGFDGGDFDAKRLLLQAQVAF